MTGPPGGTGPADGALHLDDHLLECRRPRGPVGECRWCHWAVAAPALRTLVDVHHDARRLRGVPADGVPWVVAVTDLLALAAEVDVDAITVPSVADRADQVHAGAAPDLARLGGLLTAAVAPGGPVETRCLGTAALLAAAAVQRPEHAATRALLAPDVRAAVEDAARQLSSDLQLASLLPIVERRHERTLPELRTQPAWARRPPPDRPARPGAAGAAGGAGAVGPGGVRAPEPGSLEALVVESVLDRVVGLLDGVADRLVAGPRVRLSRPAGIEPLSERTRLTVWRIARFDWHLTFVDTGRADCWHARVEAGHVVTDVPWTVALAIDAARTAGLASATHPGWPDGL